MNDTYVEWLIEKKPEYKDNVIRVLMYALTALLLLCGIFFFTPVLALAAVMAGLDWYFLPRLNLEYEYLYMARSLSIDKIFSKEKRKNAAEYDLDKMEIFAEEGAWQLDNYKNAKMKQKDFSSGYDDRRRFIMVIRDDDGMTKVILEPDTRIIDAIKQVYPSKVLFK